MSKSNDPTKPALTSRACLLNEKGEEVPITDEMVQDSMAEIKLKSIGAHTGFNKIITDEMILDAEE